MIFFGDPLFFSTHIARQTVILRDPASHSHTLPLEGSVRVKEEAGWQLRAVNQVEDFYVSPLSAATCFFAT